jgi:sigma-E factor negative regulatory protein RseC
MSEATDGSDAGISTVEGVAKVVALEDGYAVCEPEPTGSCGGCMSAALCGVKSGGTSRRIIARRFSLVNDVGLRVGDRVVVGIAPSVLLKASAVAYALPLVLMLVAAVIAQRTGDGGDGTAALGGLGGFLAGLAIARWRANRMTRAGELTPNFLRRARNPLPGTECGLD